MGTLAFTCLVLFPSLLHDLREYPDSLIGILVGSRGFGIWIAFLVIIPLTKSAPRASLGAGLLIQAYASFMMAQFDINLTNFDIIWTNMLLGFGQSIALRPWLFWLFLHCLKIKLQKEQQSLPLCEILVRVFLYRYPFWFY